MSIVLALSSDGGPVIDARPLLGVGLIPPALGPLSEFEVDVLTNGLSNDEIYAEVLHHWTREIDQLAEAMAADLGCEITLVRDAFAATLREWEQALAELVGRDLELEIAGAEHTILAPAAY